MPARILPVEPVRRQSRAVRTREQILAAAVEVMVRHGYAGLTMQRVQTQAEVTRGALTHHFSSMRELAVAAVDYVAAAQGAEIQEAAGDAGPDRLVAVLHEVTRRPTYVAGLELWVAARTDPELRAALRPGARLLGRQLREQLVPVVGELDDERLEVFVDGLLSLLRGLAIGGVLRDRPALEQAVLRSWVEAFGQATTGAGAG
ncbi:TetR/AcrR family transcriptional regulator [Nocardioides sp. L-11A]|uniref:TetR/AcrR family transcriptional regulator n=1 Tax=Nocardioides sp. L-11A TaxID=3043848 RepID=UPI00249CBA1B|nr:TetR/AcrR family transcriptional regulator [Nocardioides sp. L-11A]